MKVEIKCDVPQGADDEDVAQFVKEALETWGGQRPPSDPLFRSLRVHRVSVGSQKFEFEDL